MASGDVKSVENKSCLFINVLLFFRDLLFANLIAIIITFTRPSTIKSNINIITFKEVASCIDSETVDSQIEPELQNVLQFGDDFRIAKVQIGLLGIELVQVILAAFVVLCPS